MMNISMLIKLIIMHSECLICLHTSAIPELTSQIADISQCHGGLGSGEYGSGFESRSSSMFIRSFNLPVA